MGSMENKAAKEFLQTQQIEDCELQVGNVVLLSYPPQVPVKKLSQLLTDFASQQKPEIAWLSEDEIKDIAVGECNSENFDGFVEGGLRIQSELKTRLNR